ncbi:MAG: AAA family ATPase [Eubacterium sp.]|nr:AAA family ATPase [Eubacterium sp.]
MISRIIMKNVASYKDEAILKTDNKKEVLIYGLNGTGKSTMSNYLYNREAEKYVNCTIEGLSSNENVLVYNQQFVEDNFYNADTINGIFTLSKENKEAQIAIEKASNIINNLLKERENNEKIFNVKNTEFESFKKQTEDKLWKIKTEYSGGDRVLEYCIEGYKGNKDKLMNHLISVEKKDEVKTIEEIKKEVTLLKNGEEKIELINPIAIDIDENDCKDILSKVIVGNENSTVSKLIYELECSDWVKQGLDYINAGSDEKQVCPFCQSNTITKEFISEVKSFFDESYEKDMEAIKNYYNQYLDELQRIDNIELNKNAVIDDEVVLKFNTLKRELVSEMRDNSNLFTEKQKTPNASIGLVSVYDRVEEINSFLNNINDKIENYNRKIENRINELEILKEEFWYSIRLDKDDIVSDYIIKKNKNEKDSREFEENDKKIEQKISAQRTIIEDSQKKTVNIEEAIKSINYGLRDLGISDFRIENDEEHKDMYKLVRGEEKGVFKSLSEGEKMVISFLYFVELCKGKKGVRDTETKKIIVIDDPITSMSHIYVFNIGQLIQRSFMNNVMFEQVIVLTHNLYFFYELVRKNGDSRNERQTLIRLVKNDNISSFFEMHYNEIQNDYQSYWNIIKEERDNKVLLANCMRNILEYFFGFIDKQPLHNVFQKEIFKDNKYHAFARYINRESHSDGQNLFDFKEFDYDAFREAFRLVFYESGYKEHYNKMME